MKKLLVLIAAFLFSFSVYAQEKDKKMDKMDKMEASTKDCVMMHDGKMMVMKGGETMAMAEEMTLANGTMVMTDGMVKMKDGSSQMLKEGQCVYMDGKVGKMKMNKMKMKDKKEGTK